MFYQDPLTGYLIPVLSSAASLSSVNAMSDSRAAGFTTKAQGTSMQATEIVDVSATCSSGQPATSAEGASGREKPETPLIKPKCFDGSGSLETFLLQFEQRSEYMQWDEKARRYHLGASLEGPAGQVLWELPMTGSTSAEVIQLLQAKFGTKLQAESFQAKLKVRRRQKGESIQDL